jgi:hypothetical protein
LGKRDRKCLGNVGVQTADALDEIISKNLLRQSFFDDSIALFPNLPACVSTSRVTLCLGSAHVIEFGIERTSEMPTGDSAMIEPAEHVLSV